jgi:hypothetical protein
MQMQAKCMHANEKKNIRSAAEMRDAALAGCDGAKQDGRD